MIENTVIQQVISRQKEIGQKVLALFQDNAPSHHKYETVIAGGAPCNWFFDIPANDLDIYIHQSMFTAQVHSGPLDDYHRQLALDQIQEKVGSLYNIKSCVIIESKKAFTPDWEVDTPPDLPNPLNLQTVEGQEDWMDIIFQRPPASNIQSYGVRQEDSYLNASINLVVRVVIKSAYKGIKDVDILKFDFEGFSEELSIDFVINIFGSAGSCVDSFDLDIVRLFWDGQNTYFSTKFLAFISKYSREHRIDYGILTKSIPRAQKYLHRFKEVYPLALRDLEPRMHRYAPEGSANQELVARETYQPVFDTNKALSFIRGQIQDLYIDKKTVDLSALIVKIFFSRHQILIDYMLSGFDFIYKKNGYFLIPITSKEIFFTICIRQNQESKEYFGLGLNSFFSASTSFYNGPLIFLPRIEEGTDESTR